MNRDRLLARLDAVRAAIVVADGTIDRQKKLISRLKEQGADVAYAENTLHTFDRTRELHIERAILRRLSLA